MKIEKFDSTEDVGRVPLARGDADGKRFVISMLADGGGAVLEFEDDEAYVITTAEMIKEIIEQRLNEWQRRRSVVFHEGNINE